MYARRTTASADLPRGERGSAPRPARLGTASHPAGRSAAPGLPAPRMRAYLRRHGQRARPLPRPAGPPPRGRQPRARTSSTVIRRPSRLRSSDSRTTRKLRGSREQPRRHRPHARAARPRQRRPGRVPARRVADRRRGRSAARRGHRPGGLPRALRRRRRFEPDVGRDPRRGRQGLRLGRALDLHSGPALLRQVQPRAAPARRADRRPGAGDLRRQRHHRPYQPRRQHPPRLARRPPPARARRRHRGLQFLRLAPRQRPRHGPRHLRQCAHQEPHGPRGRGRRHRASAPRRAAQRPRRRAALPGRRRPARDLRRPGVRHRLLARLGRQGHAPARRARRDRRQLRAYSPQQPRRHGRAAVSVRARHRRADPAARRQRDLRPARDRGPRQTRASA